MDPDGQECYNLDETDPVDRLVKAIWDDVTGRGGWDSQWDDFDLDIQNEIINTWRGIVRAHIVKEYPCLSP